VIRLGRGCLTLRLELPEAAGHVLDVLQLRTLDIFIGPLEMVEWVHLSGKWSGSSFEAFTAMEADSVIPTDGGDVLV